jgi:hypothetical protein
MEPFSNRVKVRNSIIQAEFCVRFQVLIVIWKATTAVKSTDAVDFEGGVVQGGSQTGKMIDKI